MSESEPITLILFSGLAADAAVFVPQQGAFPQLTVPAWPIPLDGDTLDSYCERLAATLPTSDKMVIGGASFGGVIALHVAKFLKPDAVVLIGSIKSPSELPRLAKLARPLSPLVRFIPVRLLQLVCWPLLTKFARRRLRYLPGFARQFYQSNPVIFRWQLAQLLDWRDATELDCPVRSIHGQRDWVLPGRHTSADMWVAGAGHVLSVTHAGQVNAFLRDLMAEIQSR